MATKKRVAATLLAPELPPLVLQWIDQADIRDGATLSNGVFTDLDLSGMIASDIAFDRVVLRRGLFSESQIRLGQLLDARFDGCDLANARWEKTHGQRVEMLGCRLVGFSLVDGQCSNLLLQRCNGESARFWNSSLRDARFEHCSLKTASFENTDLSGVVFHNCDLSGADLRGAKLAGTDLRGCTLEGINVALADLRGAILEPAQLGLLAALLGVEVRELAES